MTMAAAIFGPVMVYWFVPSVISSPKPVELLLVAGGVLFCWLPVAEVRKHLRKR
jgi:hypothetical protein